MTPISGFARKIRVSLMEDIRGVGLVDLDQNRSAPMTSAPARVESELKTWASIVALRNRTDPSPNTKLHPPECKLQKLSTPADWLLGTTAHVWPPGGVGPVWARTIA
jgi:hypothetical protein